MRKLKMSLGKLGVRIIRFLSRKLHLSLLDIGLSEAGYTKSYSLEASGELSFIRDFLPKYLTSEKPLIFDVGANVGDYSALIRKFHPQALLHCFEPNPVTFSKLKKNLGTEKFLNNVGVSEHSGELELFFQKDNETSVQASLDKEILKNISGSANITSVKVQVVTLDEYCTANAISKIDFLKIDTEGFELEALKGAAKLISEKKIACIQFEFNEVNIVKRRFIKDFYDQLPLFEFFRLDENRMIPMGKWSPDHEVFKFQNIVAIQKNG